MGSTGQVNRGQGKKKKKSSAGYDPISCWFCNKKGHTQIKCRTRLRQNKPLTWKNKEVKSEFHSNKIMLITDFGDMDEARDWREKIEAEGTQTDRQANSPDFQLRVLLSST
jgi:hypothetical protein